MTDHLPECPTVRPSIHGTYACICPALRACEQRSYALGIEVGKHDGWISGHAAGVQAARDAVAALDICPECSVDEALAAIDALRDDTGSRISPGYDPAATENRP